MTESNGTTATAARLAAQLGGRGRHICYRNGWTEKKADLTETDVRAHLEGRATVGAFTGTEQVAWFGFIDTDGHFKDSQGSDRDPTPAEVEANERYALKKHDDLNALGIRHLLLRHNRRGSYHHVVRVDRIESAILGRWLKARVRDAEACKVEVETFPFDSGTPKGCRLPGQHHKYPDDWTEVYVNGVWEPWPAAGYALADLEPNPADKFPDPGPSEDPEQAAGPKSEPRAAEPNTGALPGERPGEHYDRVTDVRDVIGELGFVYHSDGKDGRTRYTRPGKKKSEGCSASVQGNSLYVFTSSITGLKPSAENGKRPYTPFGLLVALKHNGDASAAASELARLGYGYREPEVKVNWGKSGPRTFGGTRAGGPTDGKPLCRGLATTGLDGIRPKPVRWLVDKYIPSGKLTMFAGDGGHGKSTLTLALAAAVTKGKAAFGLTTYIPPPPADVLLISCEDDFEDTIVPRLLANGADLSRVHRVDGVKTPDGKPAPFSLAHYLQLEEHLEDNPKVRLVVIDPAGAYIGRAGVDDHKDSELRSLLGPLSELAGRRGVAIILVKHLNKGTSAKAVHRVGGSVGYVNAVRVAFVVAPHPDEDGLKLFLPAKLNIGKQPPGLTYSLDPLPDAEAQVIVSEFEDLTDDDRTRLAADLFRPTWLGAADMDADTALGEAAKKDRQGGGKSEEVAEWLVGFLGKYAWPDSEVEGAAKKAGYTESQLKRAKTLQRKSEPALQSQKRGFGTAVWWNWIGEKGNPPPDRPTVVQNGGNGGNGGNGQNGDDDPPDTVLFPEKPHSRHSGHSGQPRDEDMADEVFE